ncbi:MAG: methyltransferase domain-containing protein, partial [Candidatus Altiarchaeales archaeon]|nr:methyltransferase domain-containing protein [Candidatus Altiarchaeales archaeon]
QGDSDALSYEKQVEYLRKHLPKGTVTSAINRGPMKVEELYHITWESQEGERIPEQEPPRKTTGLFENLPHKKDDVDEIKEFLMGKGYSREEIMLMEFDGTLEEIYEKEKSIEDSKKDPEIDEGKSADERTDPEKLKDSIRRAFNRDFTYKTTAFPYDEYPELREFVAGEFEDVPRDGTIINVGGGSGEYFIKLLKKLGHTAPSVNIDISEVAVKNFFKKGLQSAIGDVEHLSVKPGTVDVITAAFISEYLPEPGKAFNGIYESLKPSGKAIFLFHHPEPSSIDELEGQLWVFESYQELLNAAFEVTETPSDENIKRFNELFNEFRAYDILGEPYKSREYNLRTILNEITEESQQRLKEIEQMIEADIATYRIFRNNLSPPEEWKAMLEDAGFAIESEKVFKAGEHLFFGVVATKKGTSRKPGPPVISHDQLTEDMKRIKETKSKIWVIPGGMVEVEGGEKRSWFKGRRNKQVDKEEVIKDHNALETKVNALGEDMKEIDVEDVLAGNLETLEKVTEKSLKEYKERIEKLSEQAENLSKETSLTYESGIIETQIKRIHSLEDRLNRFTRIHRVNEEYCNLNLTVFTRYLCDIAQGRPKIRKLESYKAFSKLNEKRSKIELIKLGRDEKLNGLFRDVKKRYVKELNDARERSDEFKKDVENLKPQLSEASDNLQDISDEEIDEWRTEINGYNKEIAELKQTLKGREEESGIYRDILKINKEITKLNGYLADIEENKEIYREYRDIRWVVFIEILSNLVSKSDENIRIKYEGSD